MAITNTEDEAFLGIICKEHGVSSALLNKLLELETELIGMGRRHGLYEKIGEILERAVSSD